MRDMSNGPWLPWPISQDHSNGKNGFKMAEGLPNCTVRPKDRGIEHWLRNQVRPVIKVNLIPGDFIYSQMDTYDEIH